MNLIITESGKWVEPAEFEFINGTAKRMAAVREHDCTTWTVTHVASGCAVPGDFPSSEAAHKVGLAVYRYDREIWSEPSPAFNVHDQRKLGDIIEKFVAIKRRKRA